METQVMDSLFDADMKNVKALRTILKKISLKFGYSYSKVQRFVYNQLGGDLGKVWTRRRRIRLVLDRYGINDQRSSAWHTKRGEMITASEVTKAFRSSSPAARQEIMLRKLVPQKSFGSESQSKALLWGTQFEPIAKMLYETINKVTIVDTSCVKHRVHDFLGASPDGIVITPDPKDLRWGKLVEFKCPISRKFNNDSPVPDYYWHQMQMQMECTGIDLCDYLEFRFVALSYSKWLTSTCEFKSVFVRFDDSTDIHYKPLDANYKEWIKKINPSGEEHSSIFWELAQWRTVEVPRDYTWLPTHIGELTEFWNEVLNHKKNGTLPVVENESALTIDLSETIEIGLPECESAILKPEILEGSS